MKLRNDAYALWTARRIEIETAELIDLILIMLRKPVIRA